MPATETVSPRSVSTASSGHQPSPYLFLPTPDPSIPHFHDLDKYSLARLKARPFVN